MCTCFVGVCADVPKAKRGNDGDAKKIAICFKIIETWTRDIRKFMLPKHHPQYVDSKHKLQSIK